MESCDCFSSNKKHCVDLKKVLILVVLFICISKKLIHLAEIGAEMICLFVCVEA